MIAESYREHMTRACRRHMLTERWLPSDTFGGWEYQKNGLQQFGKSAKEFIAWMMENQDTTRDKAKACLDQVLGRQIWFSSDGRYKVVKEYCFHDDPMPMVHDKMFDGTVWLSVRMCRVPGEGFYGDEHMRDWRDFQMIKQDFCGTETTAVEMYPKQNYCVDTANVFHLWVFPNHIDLPIGWKQRDVDETSDQSQRPLNGMSI